MSTIVTREGKGSALTYAEVDGNFTNLNADKVEKSGADPVVISVNSSLNALRITQTGTGNALVVEDSSNPDSTPFVINTNGNVGIGTTSPTAKLSVSGSITATGDITTGLGTVTAYYLNSSTLNGKFIFKGSVTLINTDTQVDIDLSAFLPGDTKSTAQFDFRVVGTYVSDPAAATPTVARVAKSWQQVVTYTGTTYSILGAALYGTSYASDSTNFPVGAVNATRILTVANTTGLVLRLVNRTSPATTSNTTFQYHVEQMNA